MSPRSRRSTSSSTDIRWAARPKIKERARGSKYNIAPVRREVLVGLDLVVAAESEDPAPLLQRMDDGVSGRLDVPRYGLPFAGDNNLLIDRIDRLAELPEVWWYERVSPDDGPRPGSCRLTVGGSTGATAAAPRRRCSRRSPPHRRAAAPGAWTWTPQPP